MSVETVKAFILNFKSHLLAIPIKDISTKLLPFNTCNHISLLLLNQKTFFKRGAQNHQNMISKIYETLKLMNESSAFTTKCSSAWVLRHAGILFKLTNFCIILMHCNFYMHLAIIFLHYENLYHFKNIQCKKYILSLKRTQSNKVFL